MSADGSGIIGAVVLALAAAPVLVAGAAIAGAAVKLIGKRRED